MALRYLHTHKLLHRGKQGIGGRLVKRAHFALCDWLGASLALRPRTWAHICSAGALGDCQMLLFVAYHSQHVMHHETV